MRLSAATRPTCSPGGGRSGSAPSAPSGRRCTPAPTTGRAGRWMPLRPRARIAAKSVVTSPSCRETIAQEIHMITTGSVHEQTRARYPDRTGYVERDGVRVFWEEYGRGQPTLFFLHGWPLAHSRVWKCQLPYFARHAHVLTMDCRGNGRSDRPLDPAAHAHEEHVADL